MRILFSALVFLYIGSLSAQPLSDAIKSNNYKKAISLMDAGVDINAADEIGGRPLFYAIALGNVRIIKALLDRDVNLKLRAFTEMRTILEYACSFRNLEIVKILYNAGASLRGGSTGALYLASERGYNNIALYLLENKANVHGKNKKIPIVVASYFGHGAVIDTLIDYGARFKKKYQGGKTVLMIASQRGRRYAINVLLRRGSDLDAKDYSGKTALHHAIESRQYYATRTLLTLGANPMVCDKQKENALDKAKKSRIKRLIKLVQKHSKNWQQKTTDHCSD